MKPIDIVYKRLNEGIDIRMNRYTKDVHITDEHKKGVDTSIENNPSVKSYQMNDGKTVKIYSIFKRNSGIKNMDGNPLLYALKNEKGFKFATSYDEKVFWSRFEKILDKFIQQYGEQNIAVISNEKPVWGVSSGIITPSSKPINKRILDILNSKTGITVIKDILVKKTNEEIYYMCMASGSYFYTYWNKKGMYDDMIEYLYETYLYNEDEPFSTHKFKADDTELRSTITNTIKVDNDLLEEYKEDINGKHIIIIDDTITMCQTFKSAYDVITSVYFPKSITGLTMFSEKVK